MELSVMLRRLAALARDPAVAGAGVLGGMWVLVVLVAGSQLTPQWFERLPLSAPTVGGTLVGAVVIHGLIFASARKQGWWALPAAVMAADALTGLLAGGLIAGYTLVLTPALLGFPELSRLVIDLQPPYTTPFVATVTLWALVGVGAVAGGATGLAGAVIGFPVQLVLWGLMMGLSRRHHVRPEYQYMPPEARTFSFEMEKLDERRAA